MCQSEEGDSKVVSNVKRILEAVKQEEKLCDDVETVRQFTYLGDRMSAGGGCEAGGKAM